MTKPRLLNPMDQPLVEGAIHIVRGPGTGAGSLLESDYLSDARPLSLLNQWDPSKGRLMDPTPHKEVYMFLIICDLCSKHKSFTWSSEQQLDLLPNQKPIRGGNMSAPLENPDRIRTVQEAIPSPAIAIPRINLQPGSLIQVHGPLFNRLAFPN